MRKLKLESLQVESFETTRIATRMRGTVDAHNEPVTPAPEAPEPPEMNGLPEPICELTEYDDLDATPRISSGASFLTEHDCP